MSSLRHFFTAVILLALCLCAFESFLQIAAPPDAESKSGQIRSEIDRSLVTPSSTCHHELQRLSTFSGILPSADESVVIRTNSLALRGPEPQRSKPSGVLRVIVLGDDTVFGADLKEEDCVCARLSHWLNEYSTKPVEVINASVPGYCPLLSVMQYQHSLQALSPDVVVLHFDMNDVADDYHYRRFLIESQDGSAVCRHPSLDRGNSVRTADLAEFASRSALVQKAGGWFESLLNDGHRQEADDIIASNMAYAWIQDSPPNWKTYVRHAVSPIETLQQMTSEHRIPLILSTSPTPWQVGPELVDANVSRQYEMPQSERIQTDLPMRILKAFAEPRGLAFCDPTNAFRTAAKSHTLFRTDRPGLSADGHGLYARQLARTIITNVPGAWAVPTRTTDESESRAADASDR